MIIDGCRSTLELTCSAMSRPAPIFFLVLAAVGACVSPPGRIARDSSSPDAPASAGCRPPAGISGSPRSIAEVVALTNALPQPLGLPCFLESLDRPLELHAAMSTISLQPAPTARSPRIFIFSGDVIMSVVPEGTGQSLLEMGQLVEPGRSAKAELRFPISAPIAPDYPFAHVTDCGGTTCRFCHPGEAPAPTLSPSAFVSGAFSPVYRARVDIETLRAERRACDEAAEPDRCALLRAIFDHGDVRGRDFPASVPTAFDHP
jgi:hypothetical protein